MVTPSAGREAPVPVSRRIRPAIVQPPSCGADSGAGLGASLDSFGPGTFEAASFEAAVLSPLPESGAAGALGRSRSAESRSGPGGLWMNRKQIPATRARLTPQAIESFLTSGMAGPLGE